MNNFHIYEEVGRGKDSVVYKGRKKKTVEYVAVKSVEKFRRRKVLNEVRIFHNLKNRHILKFYNWYETRNHLWIIFEYCAGGDLLQLIEQDKKLPEPTLQKFGRDLTQGLYYLHFNGIIYCDLKPSNVLLNEYSTLKLCDFGLARKLSDLSKQNGQNGQSNNQNGEGDQDGSKRKNGTPYYMAPELFNDEGVYSFQSDIWALGCVLYEMATGLPPFKASGLQQLITEIQTKPYEPITGASSLFADLLSRLLEKDPVKRISWEHLRKHPFWTKEVNGRKLPRQPSFDDYLRKHRNVEPDAFFEQQAVEGFFIPNLAHFIQPGRADAVRLSQRVKKNMLKKANGEYATGDGDLGGGDIQLKSRDQELVFETANDREEAEAEAAKNIDDMTIDVGGGRDQDASVLQDQTTLRGAQNTQLTMDEDSKQEELVFNKPASQMNVGRMSLKGTLLKQGLQDEPFAAAPEEEAKQSRNTEPAGGAAKASAGIEAAKAGQTSASKEPVMGLESNSNQNQNKVPLKTIDQLLIHNSDTAVKPIIGNKDIERHAVLEFTASSLPFEPWTAEQVAAQIESTQLEQHLHEVYNEMGASSTVNHKLNVLIYFESIILNSNVANRLINSAFMSILMKLLKNVKNPHLKMRLCSILGQLVRHSTVIGNDVAESGLSTLLCEVVKDKNEKVRRKAVASLGELLFYAATQLDDEHADPVWEIPQIAVTVLIQCLDTAEDEIVRFYACKTIENITAQSISAGCSFANLEVVTLLFHVYNTVTDEMFKISAAVSISHICKLNTTLFPTIFTSLTSRNFALALHEGAPRIQQAFITMLNIALTQPYQKLDETLQEEALFHNALSKLIENSQIVIRGKSLLTYLLMFKMNPIWFVIAIELDLYKNIDKLLRDNFKYVQCCLLCMIEQVAELIPSLITQCSDAFRLALENNGELPTNRGNTPSLAVRNVIQKSKSEYQALHGNLLLILAFLEMLKSSSFKQKLVKGPFIELLANIIEKSDQCTSMQLKQFRKATFCVVDQMAKNAKLLNLHYTDIVEKLLPAIAGQIDSQIPEVRFDALKAFSDYVTQFMCEEKIYQPLEDTASTQLLNELLLRKFLASYGTILTASEPLPLLGLKLLSVIVERNPAFVLILKKLGLISILFEYFQVGHNKFNAATLKIIRAIVASREIELEELLRMNIIEKINAIMAEFVTSNPEWCSDHLLVIMHEILHLAAELKKKRADSTIPQQVFDELLVNFSAFCKLLSESDVSIVEGASYTMLAFIHFSMIQGIQTNRMLTIQDAQVGTILPAFKLEKQIVAKNLLKSLFWALSLGQNPLVLSVEHAKQLAKVGEQYIQNDDKSLRDTAREVVKLCKMRFQAS